MGSMVRLILVRHGSTALSEQGRYQGWIDVPLTPRGIREAGELGRRWNSMEIDALWSSDLRRARQTAEIAFPGRSVGLDPRLREIDFGVFDGLTYEENRKRFEGSFCGWLEDPASGRPPGGESLGELEARVASWLNEVASDRELPGDRLHMAVTHGGVMRVAMALAHGIPFADAARLSLPPCASVEIDAGAFEAGVR